MIDSLPYTWNAYARKRKDVLWGNMLIMLIILISSFLEMVCLSLKCILIQLFEIAQICFLAGIKIVGT